MQRGVNGPASSRLPPKCEDRDAQTEQDDERAHEVHEQLVREDGSVVAAAA
jgi:hypothetical protein